MDKRKKLEEEIQNLEFDIDHDEKILSSVKGMIEKAPENQRKEMQKEYDSGKRGLNAAKAKLKKKKEELGNM